MNEFSVVKIKLQEDLKTIPGNQPIDAAAAAKQATAPTVLHFPNPWFCCNPAHQREDRLTNVMNV